MCNVLDVCELGDDNIDTDGDGIPDACDLCDPNFIGTSCDDGDPNTTNDMIDVYCDCNGTPVAGNDCGLNVLYIPDAPTNSGNYGAVVELSSDGTVETGSNVNFVGGQVVTLDNGFEVKAGADFLGINIPCPPNN